MKIPGATSRLLDGLVVGGAAIGVVVFYFLGKVIYNLFFHPLAKYAGPKFAAISDLWYALNWTSGRWPFIMKEMHKKYGDVVRIGYDHC